MRLFGSACAAGLILLMILSTAEAQVGKSVVVGTMTQRPNAVMVLNPPDANQGFILPQLSMEERTSMKPSSPLEDGLIVFDTTEKSFYYWKDNTWVKGLDSSSKLNLRYDPLLSRLALGASDEIDLSALKEIPSVAGNSGKYLTTNGASVSWSTATSLDNQQLSISGNQLSLTNDVTPVDLSTLAANGQVTGPLNTLTIAANSITSSQLQNGSVMVSKLASNGITDANKFYSTNTLGVPQLESKVGLITGVLAAGDLSGTYPAPAVGKLQGNAVSPSLLTIADAGKLLMWDGTQWVPQVITGVGPATHFQMIDPAEFTNLRSSDKKDKDNIIIFEDNSTYVTTIKKTEGSFIIAPMQLPHGAKIEQITLYYMDREARNVVFDVFRKTPTGANESVVTNWSSSGSSATIQNSVHNPIAGREVVDNENYSYRIVVNLDQTNDVNDPTDATLRVYAVKVKYLQ